MGLDTVEFILAIEDTFDISIEDEDAKSLLTVGDVYDCILRKLDKNGSYDEEQVWTDLQDLVVKWTGVKHEEVIKDARIVKDLGMN